MFAMWVAQAAKKQETSPRLWLSRCFPTKTGQSRQPRLYHPRYSWHEHAATQEELAAFSLDTRGALLASLHLHLDD